MASSYSSERTGYEADDCLPSVAVVTVPKSKLRLRGIFSRIDRQRSQVRIQMRAKHDESLNTWNVAIQL